MKATIKIQCEVECIQEIHEETGDTIASTHETFMPGEEIDADLLNEVPDENTALYVQFPNGDVAWLMPAWVEVTHLEEYDEDHYLTSKLAS